MPGVKVPEVLPLCRQQVGQWENNLLRWNRLKRVYGICTIKTQASDKCICFSVSVCVHPGGDGRRGFKKQRLVWLSDTVSGCATSLTKLLTKLLWLWDGCWMEAQRAPTALCTKSFSWLPPWEEQRDGYNVVPPLKVRDFGMLKQTPWLRRLWWHRVLVF